MTLINAQKGNQTVAAYFASLRGLADELAAVGKAIQDDELISYIIHGLDVDYQPLVSALDARVMPVSLDELYAMLGNYDQRMAQFNHLGSGGFVMSSMRLYLPRVEARLRGITAVKAIVASEVISTTTHVNK